MKIEIALHDALTAPVKRKRNNTGHLSVARLSAQARRVAAQVPEVMVKVSGFGRGGAHVRAHLNYISRHGKLDLENARGEALTGREAIRQLADDWGRELTDKPRRRNQRDTLHLVLSMPAGTRPELVRTGSRAFTNATFGRNHDFIFALHTDTPHPHCHVTVRCEGFDGRWLHYNRADLQAWREGFAWQMRQLGVAAEATPRVVRGVVKKADKAVIRHISVGDATHRPRVARVRALAALEAVELLRHGVKAGARPWDARIADNLAQVRRAWDVVAGLSARGHHRLTYQGEVACNERPDYSAGSAYQRRERRGFLAVPEPGVAGLGSGAFAGAVAGLRDLSAGDVVRRRGGVDVLLPTHAHGGVDDRARPDLALRRTGIGVAGPGGGEVSVAQPARVSLAQLVARFAQGLPVAQAAGRDPVRQAGVVRHVEPDPQR